MATCGSCWQPRGPRAVYGGSEPVVDRNGMMALRDYPDCTEPYNDLAHRSETVYVVAWGTEHERLFKAVNSHRAAAYASSFNPRYRIDPALTTQLCRQAVLDLYAAAD